MSLSSLTEEESLFIATGRPDRPQAYTHYGTLPSSGSSSETLHQYQLSGDKDADNVIIKVTEIAEQEGLDCFNSRKFWLIFGCICWNEYMACFDGTIMASSHPVITSEFHSSNSASWLSTSFLITSTACMSMFAPLSDTIGRRPIMLVTLAILGIAVVWCSRAQSIGSLIAARALCGLGAGGTSAMGAVLLNDFVPIEVRATYQSVLNLAFGFGQASGMALGGILCDTIGWRWAFGIQVPGVIFCGTVFFFVIPKDLGPQLAKNSKGAVRSFFKTFDLTGSVLLALSLTCLILYLNLGGNLLRWSHPCMTAVLIVFFLAAASFVRVESTAKHPVMPLRLITSWPQANIIFSSFFGALIYSGLIFNVPLYFEVVKHDSATVAGFRLIVPFMSLSASGFLGCMMIRQKRAIRPALVFGSFLTLAGTFCLSFLGRSMSSWMSMLCLLPFSIGYGFISPISTICMLRASPTEEHAVSICAFLLWRKIAVVIGVAFSTLLVQNLLVRYLYTTVTGPHQKEIIYLIRKSVHAIRDLSARHQVEVVAAYSVTLRITFSVMIIFGVILVALVLPIKIPEEDVMEGE